MKKSALFLPAKTKEYGAQTILEHGLQVMGVGRFLYDTLKPEFDRQKYLWACLFHDAGKIIAPPGSGKPHGPVTQEGVNQIKNTPAYMDILERLKLPDLSNDTDTINCMAQHHNLDAGAYGMSIHISAADMIASGTQERGENKPVTPALSAYWNALKLRTIRFPDLTIFNASKNETISIGKAMMLSLLLDALEEIEDVGVLYLHSNGIRIATKKDDQALRKAIGDSFQNVLKIFYDGQDIKDLLIGSGQSFGQLQTLPESLRETAKTAIVKKYARDIVLNAFDLRKEEKSKQMTDDMLEMHLSNMGLSQSILERFVMLDELRQLTTNIAGAKTNLLIDDSGYVDPDIAERNNLNKKIKRLEGAEPTYMKLLNKAGADKNAITKKHGIETVLPGFAVAIKQYEQNVPAPEFNINDYLAINAKIPVRSIPSQVCANCGTYPGEIDLSMIAFLVQQHIRETLFRMTTSQARKESIKVCGLCNFQALLNTFLSGVEVDRNQARIKPHTHAIIWGINIGQSISEKLKSENELLYQRLTMGYKILEKNIITHGPNGVEMVALSFSEFKNAITNRIYRHLLFSDFADMVLRHIKGIVAIGINYVPDHYNPEALQMEDGVFPIITDHRLTFFRWVEYDFKLHLKDEAKRDYILQYAHQPLIGLNQLIRREKRDWQSVIKTIKEDIDIMVNEMNTQEKNVYYLAEKTWTMARLAGELSIGKNVGAFIKCFRGRPEDIDRLTSRLLKNEKLAREKRDQIVSYHQELRSSLENMTNEEQRYFADYLQKTKYLFNTRMWVRVHAEKEVDNENN